ncbi:MAG: gamma-glutamylcyclotransferase [Stappiaceae bacterium]
MSNLWVFGYGSLMWRPGFPHIDTRPARLSGFHRALCIYSWVHRGTQERPGLVLGLDKGGSCRGMAFEVAEADKDQVITYLRAREQVTMVYLEHVQPITLEGGTAEQVDALCYVVDSTHEQYAGALPLESQVQIVREGIGQSGANPEYVLNTADHLAELNIEDPDMQWLATRLRETEIQD